MVREPNLDALARYEELRAAVLSGAVGLVRLGLALVLRSGVAAWTEAWSALALPPPTLKSADAPSPKAIEGDVEVVNILVAMACSVIEGGR